MQRTQYFSGSVKVDCLWPSLTKQVKYAHSIGNTCWFDS